MTKFIRENSKKLLAIFGVVLMIAFVLPVGMKSGLGSHRQLVGYIAGDKKVYNTDISHAKSQWEILEHFVVLSPQATPGHVMSLVEAIAMSRNNDLRTLATQVQAHPETFFLLQQEALNMGIRVTPQQAEQFLRSQNLYVRLQSGAVVDLNNVSDLVFRDQIIDAIAGFLRVEAALERVSDVVKVSEPLTKNELAAQMQRMKVRYAALSAKDFVSKVPAPTREQLQEQFDKFSKYEPDVQPSSENPHGFGYKFPNRVTLQYIGVPREEVRKVVRAGKSEYDWEVEAQQYYLRHTNEFQSASPSGNFDLGPATRPANPTTRPFAEVKDQIIEKLMTPEIDRKSRDAQDRIVGKLTADWTAHHAAHPTSGPTTATSTTTTVGPADFTSYDYIKRVAAEVQKQTGVMPVTGQIAQLATAKDLAKEPGIGGAAQSSGLSFAVYATDFAAPTMPAAEQNNAGLLQLFQPSVVLKDPGKSSYVFRLTAARPAEKPQSLDEVARQVEEDWRLAKAYELAKQQAQALADAARRANVPTTQQQSLAAATPPSPPSTQPGTQPTTEPSDQNAALALAATAKATGLDTTVTGWFNQQGPAAIPNLSLDPGPSAVFRIQAAQLLNHAATQPSTPAVAVIELPLQQKVFAAQLAAVEPVWDSTTLPLAEVQVEQMIKRDLSEGIRSRWLTYDAVARRTGWRDEGHPGRQQPSGNEGGSPPVDTSEPPLGG